MSDPKNNDSHVARLARAVDPLTDAELQAFAEDVLRRRPVNIGDVGRLVSTVASLRASCLGLEAKWEEAHAKAERLRDERDKLTRALRCVARDERMTADHLRGIASGALSAMHDASDKP